MTVFTSRFGFKWNYQPHDTGWGTDYNFAHRELAALLHPIIISDTVTTPPGSPSENDAYFVPLTGATGAWSTNAGKLAAYQGGAWQYYTPEVGTRMRVVSRSAFYWWNGTALTAEVTSGGGGSGVLTVAGHSPDIAGDVALVVADITGAAPLSSPTFTGAPLAPTASAHNNSTRIATTAYVDGAISALGGVTTLTAGTGITLTGSGAYTISVTTGTYLLLTGGTMTGDLHLAAPSGSDNTDKAVSSAWVRTYVTSLGLGTGSGSVTSVALTLPSWLSVSGSPVTTSGTLAVTANTQVANTVLAGPTTGANAAPTFRAMVAADLPSGIGSNIPVWLPFSAEGALTASEVLPGIIIPGTISIASGASGVAKCKVAPAASSFVITFDKNGTSFATATFTSGSTTGTVSVTSTTSFASGDVIGWSGPSSTDATFSDPKITLTATR